MENSASEDVWFALISASLIISLYTIYLVWKGVDIVLHKERFHTLIGFLVSTNLLWLSMVYIYTHNLSQKYEVVIFGLSSLSGLTILFFTFLSSKSVTISDLLKFSIVIWFTNFCIWTSRELYGYSEIVLLN